MLNVSNKNSSPPFSRAPRPLFPSVHRNRGTVVGDVDGYFVNKYVRFSVSKNELARIVAELLHLSFRRINGET